MKSKYDKGARVRRQTLQLHRVRTGRITKPGTATPRIRPKKKPNGIPKDLLEIQLKTSSPFISLSPASIMCRNTLRCGCRKAHITGSAWGMLTATLEQVVKNCRAATYWGALTIERIPDPSHEGGVRVMVRNTDLYSEDYTEFPMPNYDGPEALLKGSFTKCSIVKCPACMLLAGVNKFVTETINRAEDLEIEALSLLNFFAKLRIELKTDPETNRKVADPHKLLWNGATKHLYRRSAYQMMLLLVGELGNQNILYPDTNLTYAGKVKLLCRQWFGITLSIFDRKSVIRDPSDKIFLFDHIFTDEKRHWRRNGAESDSECVLCNENANQETKMVHLLCGHTLCVACCKHWRVHSPVDIRDYTYRYRCPICRKCMRCGAQDCAIHVVKTSGLPHPVLESVPLWPLPLEPLLQLGMGLDSVPTLNVPDVNNLPDLTNTPALPDVPTLRRLNPFRNMKASACVKLREDSLELRVRMGYNLIVCLELLHYNGGEMTEEFHEHCVEVWFLLHHIRDLFYRADLRCDWSSHVSDQPFFLGQLPDIALPRSFPDTPQVEAGALTNRLRNASYESNWDTFDWGLDLRDQPKTHYWFHTLPLHEDRFCNYLATLFDQLWYDPEMEL